MAGPSAGGGFHHLDDDDHGSNGDQQQRHDYEHSSNSNEYGGGCGGRPEGGAGGGGMGGSVQGRPLKTLQQQRATVWRRREAEPPTTEGSLRALLNKLAPSDSLASLANQVASHLTLEDDAPEQLARQLVERAQLEPLFAGTYAKLCSVLVRVRSGFVFYKHLVNRCRATFTVAVRTLILEAADADVGVGSGGRVDAVGTEHHRQQLLLQSSDLQRHRLKALVVFLCHLFLENLLCFERLDEDYLRLLEAQLPDCVALECLCSALNVAGSALEAQRPSWVIGLLRQLQDVVHHLHEQQDLRRLRMTFMVKDLVELHQRNWRPRESQYPGGQSPVEQAEP